MDTVRYGSRGNGVLLLQLALKREGSYRGELDGLFGTRTLNGVRRFQSAHGLTPDGVAGAKTNAAAEPYLSGYVRVKLRPGDSFYRLAKRFGTRTEALVTANPGLDPADLPVGAEITVPLGFPVVPTDAPCSSGLLGFIAEGLRARYPFIGVSEAGRSVLGKPITVFTVGRGDARVLVAAAHHANEWITSTLTLDFLETYAAAYSAKASVEGRSAAALFGRVKLILVPTVDPDGVDLVNSAISKKGFARALSIAEGYPDIPFPQGWKANAEGIDLNLSYPADWEEARRMKFAEGYTRPAPRDYVGSAPLEAPEARALYELTLREDPDMVIAYHTQGGEIYPRYKDIEPEGSAEIAKAMAEVSGYEVAEVPDASSRAGYRDWFIDRFRRPGFTVEAGRGRNPLPLSSYGELRRDNFPLIVTAMEKAGRKKA